MLLRIGVVEAMSPQPLRLGTWLTLVQRTQLVTPWHGVSDILVRSQSVVMGRHSERADAIVVRLRGDVTSSR